MEKRRQLASDTGLYTYETFEILFNYEIARVKRYPGPLTLIHLALATENLTPEFIKQAHTAMTNLLDRTLRISDVPAHYKDEFLILLPSADRDAAHSVAEKSSGNIARPKASPPESYLPNEMPTSARPRKTATI